MSDHSNNIYIVKDILATKLKNGERLFLVHWEGYSHDQNTWEPLENLENVKWMIDDFMENKFRLDKEIKQNKLKGNLIPKKIECKTTK